MGFKDAATKRRPASDARGADAIIGAGAIAIALLVLDCAAQCIGTARRPGTNATANGAEGTAAGVGFEGARVAPRDDVDYTANGIRTVERRGAAAEDLDAGDGAEWNCEIERVV